ncbi:MAG: DNA repair protein RadA [Acidimicrobiia bacterium]|nr:DNA repair protein RadA [Acidimicrobiia bacterium]
MSFECASCGYAAGKWAGFCPRCPSSDALVPVSAVIAGAVTLSDWSAESPMRRVPSLPEVDRVLGGGMVAGSAIVIGGEPGVGKSTLMLQVAGAVDGRVAIISAEETAVQVSDRARRLGIDVSSIALVAQTSVDAALEAALATDPSLLVVDSLQTVSCADVDASAGAVTQVRESASRLVGAAKRAGVPLVLVSHVTKAGHLAGPKTVEHLVDVVLSLEGDPRLGLRFLRPLKNRFGRTGESGVLEMTEQGLVAVPELFAAGAADPAASGAVTFPGADGRRVIAMEVQALVAAATGDSPRRSAQGVPRSRLDQVIAVLDRHVGIALSRSDVYVKVSGGTRVSDPAIDLALAVALVSSATDRPAGPIAVWGEIGLTGGVERVAHDSERRSAARRLGLRTVEQADGPARLADVLAAAGVVGQAIGAAAS